MAVATLPTGELVSAEINFEIAQELQREAATFAETHGMQPGLAIVTDNYLSHCGTQKYMATKTDLAHQLGFRVHAEVWETPSHDGQTDVQATNSNVARLGERVERLNDDPSIHGIIVQLPLADRATEAQILDMVAPAKDVDALGAQATLTPPTALAIEALLAGYGVDVATEPIAIFGLGRLVGNPFYNLVRSRGNSNAQGFDIDSDLEARYVALNEARVIVTAMGLGGAITPDFFEDISTRRVVIDAGTAEADGSGDISAELRAALLAHGSGINKRTGSVGPATAHMLLRNTLEAAKAQI